MKHVLLPALFFPCFVSAQYEAVLADTSITWAAVIEMVLPADPLDGWKEEIRERAKMSVLKLQSNDQTLSFYEADHSFNRLLWEASEEDKWKYFADAGLTKPLTFAGKRHHRLWCGQKSGKIRLPVPPAGVHILSMQLDFVADALPFRNLDGILMANSLHYVRDKPALYQTTFPMAYKGKTILNSKTGIETKFLQTSKDTGGQLLEMETTYPARSLKPPPHYHPHQEEEFVILSGEMTVNMDGQLRILKQGDTLHIPKNMVHSMWNHTKEKTVVNWQVRPALDSEYLFETTTGLANDGKTSRGGRPNMLQTAVLMTRFSDEFLLVKPPRWVQRLVFGLLAPVGWVLGYRGVYREYVD